MQAAPVRPDRTTLLAFAALVAIAGVAPVAVRITNRDLPPFFGAGLRFGIAALIFLAIVVVRRIPLPRGRALLGAILYGVLGFGGFFALAYWALVRLPAGIAGLMMASVPLFTFIFAVVHGVEKFRMRGLIGAAIAIAESGIVIKKFPPKHPVATNGVAMATGTILLLAVSALSRERWSLPS